MTNNKQSFWKAKKFDIMLFILVAILNFGVGGWFYSKYQAIDNAREKVEQLNKNYMQIKSMRIIAGELIEVQRQLIKELYLTRKISVNQFFMLDKSLLDLKSKIHVMLSKQE